MSRQEILEMLGKFKQKNAEQYGILTLGIFGSYARDEAHEESDVDLFVTTKTPNPFLLIHMKDDLENQIHKKVDIVRFREKMNPYLKKRIETEGVYV